MAKRKREPEPIQTVTYRAASVKSLEGALPDVDNATLTYHDNGTCDVTGPRHVHDTLAGNGARPCAGGSDSVAD